VLDRFSFFLIGSPTYPQRIYLGDVVAMIYSNLSNHVDGVGDNLLKKKKSSTFFLKETFLIKIKSIFVNAEYM
jgi:hypothetical protein